MRQHSDESLQTLQFGARALCVRNRPVVNERTDVRQLTAELLAALAQGTERASGLEAALNQTQEERDALQVRRRAVRPLPLGGPSCSFVGSAQRACLQLLFKAASCPLLPFL